MKLSSSLLWAVSLGAVSTPLGAQDQAKLERACETELARAERSINDARSRPEYKTDKGRMALTAANRYVNQARNHAAKGESRSCATAAKKGRAQLSAQRGR
jgi:hypothetical protein